MHREATLQQIAPIDSAGFTRLFAVGGAVVTLGAALLMTFFERDQVANWPVEVAALALLALTGVVHVAAASPFRSPFHASSHVLVLSGAIGCFVLDELAQLGENRIIHDDWGLVVIPVYLLLLAGVRPAQEVFLGGLVATVVVGTVAFLISPLLAVPAPPFARASVAMTSVLPAAIAAAAFSRSSVLALRLQAFERSSSAAQRAVDIARTSMLSLDADAPVGGPQVVRASSPEHESVRLSVQQENIAQLEAEFVPLIAQVIAADALSEADGRRARELATDLRRALVAELARDWLSEAGFAVSDPEGYAERMTPEQRTAVHGIVEAVPLLREERPGSAELEGQDLEAELRLRLLLRQRPVRAEIAPAIAVLRTVFPNVEHHLEDDAIEVVAQFRVPARR